MASPPERPVFELEVERETDDDGMAMKVELEIKWLKRAKDVADGIESEPATNDDGNASMTSTDDGVVEDFGCFEVYCDMSDE